MGKVFDSGSIRIVIYTNDHNPAHCHVIHEDWEVKLDIRNDFSILDYSGRKIPPFKELIKIAKDHRYIIGKTWRDYHGN